jgi:hypothetical protein
LVVLVGESGDAGALSSGVGAGELRSERRLRHDDAVPGDELRARSVRVRLRLTSWRELAAEEPEFPLLFIWMLFRQLRMRSADWFLDGKVTD